MGHSAKAETPASVSTSLGYPDIVSAFSDVADAMAAQVPLDELLHLTAQKVCRLFGVQRCSIYLRESDSDLFRGQVAEVGSDVDERIKRLVCGVESDGFTREILETRRPVLIHDATRDPRPVRAVVRAWNVRAMLGVPMIVQDDVIGIMFLDDNDVRHEFRKEDDDLAAVFANLAAVAISQARAAEDLRTSAATIARQNKLLRRSSVLEERVTALALEGTSVQDIARAVATVTNEPCFIHSADLRRLAAAAPAECDAPARSLFDPRVSAACTNMALAGLERGKGPVVLGPFAAEGLHRRFLVAPIIARDECWGYLVITEMDRRLTALDMGVARRAASIAALELSTSRRSAAAEDKSREALMRDLLSGSADPNGLRDRALQHGLDVEQRYAVVIVHPRDRRGALVGREPVERAFARCGEGATMLTTARDDGSVAVLAPLDRELSRFEATQRLKSLVESAVETLSSESNVVASVSSACTMPGETAQALDEAEKVLQVLLTVGARGGGAVLTADDLGVGRLILASSSRSEAQRFAQHTLGPLLEEEGRANDLLRTLCVFFDSCRSVRRSAAQLGVHENTIRYRLARVAEVTGLDLAANPDHQLSGQLAVLILRLQGQIIDAHPVEDGAVHEVVLAS
jgi:GAF domain-containing protein